jgi:hypothetical protein
VTDRPSGRDGFGSGDDGARVDAVVRIELRDRAGLPEVLDAERPRAVSGNGAEPIR